MTEIPKILNPDFLLQIVAIESIRYHSQVDNFINEVNFTSLVKLKVMVIEPSQETKSLSENIYTLELLDVDKYSISFGDNDERTFEFDTDEITLEGDKESKRYILRFINAYTRITISFSGLTRKLESKKALSKD